jgi:hypothetical protein
MARPGGLCQPSGRPLRARPDEAAGFAHQSAWLAALAAAELASAADAAACALRAQPRAADPPPHWAARANTWR